MFAANPRLAEHAAHLLTHSLAESTSANYRSGERTFYKFCYLHNIPSKLWLPPSESTLLAFVAWMAKVRAVGVNRVVQCISGVRETCEILGLEVAAFSSPRLSRVLRTVARENVSTKPKRHPFTVVMLDNVHKLWPFTTWSSIVAFAAISVGIHGLLRASEYVHKAPWSTPLLRRHIALYERACILNLPAAKTDPFKQGQVVTIYSTGSASCPVRWIRYIFEHSRSKSADAPLFQDLHGSQLEYRDLQGAIKSACRLLRLDPTRFSSHSLRSGGATSLAMAGCPAHVIQKLGRWKSHIFTKAYINMPSSSVAPWFRALNPDKGRRTC